MTTRNRDPGRSAASPASPASPAMAQGTTRNEGMEGVQRNYETLSKLMTQKNREVETLRAGFLDEQAKAISLGVKLEEASQRAKAAEDVAAKFKTLPEQLAALQSEVQRLRFDASLANGRSTNLEDKLGALSRAAEETEFGTTRLRRELHETRLREGALQESIENLQKQLQDERQEVESLKLQLVGSSQDGRGWKDQIRKAERGLAKSEQLCQSLSLKVASRDETILTLQATIKTLQGQVEDEKSARQTDLVSLAATRGNLRVAQAQASSLERSLAMAEDQRDQSKDALNRAALELSESQASCASHLERSTQLTALLEAAEEKATANLTQRVQSDEVITALQIQLQQCKALLTDSKRQMKALEDASKAEVHHHRDQADSAASFMRDVRGRMEQQRKSHSGFVQVVSARLDKALNKLAMIQKNAGQGMEDLSSNIDRTVSSFEFVSSIWERNAADTEVLLSSLSTHVLALVSSSEARQSRDLSSKAVVARRQGNQPEAAPSISNQQQIKKISELEAELHRERSLVSSLRSEAARVAAVRAEELRDAKESSDSRVEAERRRLSTRLDGLAGEVERLEAACSQAGMATREELRLEKERMSLEALRLRGEADSHKRKAEEAEHAKIRAMGSDQMSVLSRLHQVELEGFMSQAKAREEALEGALKSVRGNLLASIDSSQKLLGDMALVSAHLNRHGWEVKHDLSPGGEAPLEPSSGIDDGGAGKLAKALLRLRLHFSYITEAVQNNVVSRTQASMAAPSPAKAPSAVLPLDIPTVKTFTRAENDSAAALLKEIKGIMSRLLHAEEALAPTCTCLACMGVMTAPVTCVPCGHTLCCECLKREGCVECGGVAVQTWVANTPLEAICSKYEFKLSALTRLRQTMNGLS